MKDILIEQPGFGQRLRRRRTELGLSQKELAGNLMTPSYISLLENGSRVPSLDVVVRLTRLLKTTPEELLGYNIEGLVAPGAPAEPSALVSQIEARRLTEMGDLAGARVVLSNHLETLRGQGDDERLLAFGMGLIEVLTASGEHAERLAMLDELDRLPVVQRSDAVQLMLSVDRAATLRALGQFHDALAVAQKAAATVGQSELAGSPEHVRLLGVLASVLCEIGNFAEAGPVAADMVTMASRTGHIGTLGRARWAAALVYSRMGRSADAYAQLVEAHKMLVAGGMPVRDWVRFCRVTAAILIDCGGDLDESRRWLEAAEINATLAGLPADVNATRRERAHYELAAGHPAAAAEIYTELVNDDTMIGSELTAALAGLGEALARLDRPAEAADWLRKAAQHYEDDGNYRRATEVWRQIDTLRVAATEAPAGRAARPVRPSKARGRQRT